MAELRRMISGFLPSTRYALRIRAINRFGVPSNFSEVLEFNTPADDSIPNAPANLVVDFDTPDLILRWDAVTENSDGSTLMDFSHYRVVLTTPGAQSVTIDTSQAFLFYSFTQNKQDFGIAQPSFGISVYAVDVSEKPSLPLVGSAVNPIPSTPLIPTGTASLTMMAISMTPNPVDIDIKDYLLERAIGAGPFTEIGWQTGDSHIESGTSNETYHFRYKVRDYFDQISLEYSPTLSLNTEPIPGIDTEPPIAVQDFTIQSSGINELTGEPYVNLIWTPNNVDTDLSHFELRIVRTSDSFVRSILIGPGASSYTVEGLLENTQYSFAIYAYDYSGNRSGSSTVLTHTTGADDSAPPIPAGTDTIGGYRHITVIWGSVTHPQFSHYEVHASKISGFIPDVTNLTFTGNATRYMQNTGDSETWYFRVRAVNANGQASDFSPEFLGVSAAGFEVDTTPPNIPSLIGQTFNSGVYVNTVNRYAAFLEWQWAANTEEDMHAYEVRYSTESSLGPWVYIQTPENKVRIENLNPGAVIYLGVRALDVSLNASDWVATSTTLAMDTIAPVAPVIDVENTGVVGPDFKVAWTHIKSDDFRQYRITVYTGDATPASTDFYTQDNHLTFTFAQNQASFGTASPALTFEVRAIDMAGNESSAASQSLTNAIPGVFEITGTGGSVVTLTWPEPSGNDISHYVAQRRVTGASTYVTVATVTSRQYVDVPPEPGNYDYRVIAYDVYNQLRNSTGGQNIPVTPAFIEDTTPPDTPTQLLGYPTTGLDDIFGSKAWVEQRWSAVADPGDFSHYRIEISTVAGTVGAATITDRTTGIVKFGNLATNTAYTVAVWAVDTSGNASTPLSASITSAEDNVPPAIPSGFQANGGIDTIAVSWLPSEALDLAYYELHMDTLTGFTPSESNRIYKGPGTSFSITLPAGTTRHFRVRAVDYAGNPSGYAASISATTTGIPVDDEPPSNVTGVTTSSSTYFHGEQERGAITVSWVAATDNIGVTHYILRVKKGTGAYEEVVIGSTSTQHTLTNLDPGTTYYFQLKAADAAGNLSSAWSTEVQRTIATEAATTPSQVTWPVTGAAEDLSPGSIRYMWNAVTNTTIQHYEVQVDTANTFNTVNLRTFTTDGTYVVVPGVPGTTYHVRVRAHSVYGLNGAYSVTQSVVARLVDDADVNTISADKLITGSINTGDITVNSKLIVGTGGIFESANYDISGSTGYRMTDTSIDFRQGSIILAGNTGLNINTSTNQMWFGAATFANAAWRVDSTGTMRVGTTDARFNVTDTGELRIGANTTVAPTRITNTGLAEFRNVRISTAGVGTPTVNTDILNIGDKFIIRRLASTTTDEVRLAGNMFIDAGGDLQLNGGSISLTSGDLTLSGGNIVVSSGYISSSTLVTLPATGYRLNSNGVLEANNAVISGSLNVTGGNVYTKTETDDKDTAVDEGVRTDFTGTATGTLIDGAFIKTGTIQANKLNITVGGGNLLANSSFESWASGSLLSWSKGSDVTHTQVVGRVNGNALRFSSTVAGNTGTSRTNQNLTFPINSTFTITAWVRRISGTGLVGFVVDPIASAVPGNATPTVWTRITWTFSAGATAGTTFGVYQTVIGDVWDIDDIQAEVGNVPTAYSPKTDEILPGTIVTDMLDANAITADIIRTGTLTASVGIGTNGFVYAGASPSTGARVVMTPSGLYGYNSSNVEQFGIDSATGSARFAGALAAASGTFTGNLTGTSMTLSGNLGVTGTVTAGSTTLNSSGLTMNQGSININSGVFQVTSAGALTATSATITGAITATSGSFTGQVTINSGGSLVAGGTTLGPTGITLNGGSINLGSGKFVVTSAGALTATEATITGQVTATSGSFTGDVSTGNLTATGGTIGGITINQTNLSGGTISGSMFNIGAGGIAFTGNGNITWEPLATGGIQLSNNGFINNLDYRTDATTGWHLGNDGLVINDGLIKTAALQVGVNSENLLINSSFGDGTTVADGWTDLHASGTHTLEVSNEYYRYGRSSQKLEATANTTYMGIYQEVQLPDDRLFPVGQRIAVSYWVRQQVGSARNATIYVEKYDTADETSRSLLWDGNNFSLTVGGWTRVTAIFLVPAGLLRMRVHLRVGSSVVPVVAGDVFYIDGAQLQLADHITSYSPRSLELPTNYIQSASISDLTADKLISGVIGAHTIVLGGVESVIQSINYNEETGLTDGWQFTGDGRAMFQNGSVTVIGASGSVVLDAQSLRASYGGETKFQVDDTGVYIGGSGPTNSDVYFDGSRTVFQSSAGAATFSIDTNPIDGKILKLSAGSEDNFYLDDQGLAYFRGGIIDGRVLEDNSVPGYAIESLSVDRLSAGSLGIFGLTLDEDGRLVTGGMTLDAEGIHLFDELGRTTVRLSSQTGRGEFSGSITSSEISIGSGDAEDYVYNDFELMTVGVFPTGWVAFDTAATYFTIENKPVGGG